MTNKFLSFITITGPKKALTQFERRAKGIPANYAGDLLHPCVPLSFHALLPVPSAQLARRYTRRSGAHVADSGRDWELAHWGCPRGAIESNVRRDANTLRYCILTLVATPIKFFRSVSAMFPGLSFDILSSNPRSLSKTTARFVNGKRTSVKKTSVKKTSVKKTSAKKKKMNK